MRFIALWLTVSLLTAAGATIAAGIRADHSCISEFEQIPPSVVADIASGYRIYYGHTSHGSQIMSGLDYLEAENGLYNQPVFHERSDDLGHNGDTSWVADMRTWLAGHPDYNMAMMSWCGGASDNTVTGINIYLDKMNELETDYPSVTFIYMTGHLDGGGPSGTLYRNNNLIRDYCSTNNKILFDFADIESYDPAGTYYPDESDNCGWCSTWCLSHSCCTGTCAHSHCFNCYQKGKAWWWMMATIDGWSIMLDVGDNDPNGLPDSYRLLPNYPNPFNPGTTIAYNLARSSPVLIDIYNLAGQRVKRLVSTTQSAGYYIASWDGNDDAGHTVASGVYFYRIQADEFLDSKKMVLLK